MPASNPPQRPDQLVGEHRELGFAKLPELAHACQDDRALPIARIRELIVLPELPRDGLSVVERGNNQPRRIVVRSADRLIEMKLRVLRRHPGIMAHCDRINRTSWKLSILNFSLDHMDGE